MDVDVFRQGSGSKYAFKYVKILFERLERGDVPSRVVLDFTH